MESAAKSCILCGACKRELLIESGSWKIYRCTLCGLGSLDPHPTKEELSTLYSREYFAAQYDEGVEPESPEFKKWLSLLEHRVRFFRAKKRAGKLLDIGCGNGYFLALCRSRGYEVQGIDISKWASKYATQRLGLSITTGEIDDVNLPAHYFDIITMWHTLEHTPNPRHVMLKVKNWLKEDGILVVEVPNYEGTDARRHWKDWIGWQFPFHFYHFTPQTLKQLLEIFGFRVVKTKDYHSETVKEALKRIPVINIFARLISKMFSGHSIAVIAKLDDHMS